jgi:membrane protein implicated in regulation of membrane protease activity
MFFVLALLLLIFLPSPWNLVGALVSLILFVLEVGYWQRRMRAHKVQTGVENLVGATGEVTTTLSPRGQIRVHGELWEARSATPVEPGARVRVVAVDGLTLEVERAVSTSGRGTQGLGPAALVAAAVLALAACGGDNGESASESYANSVCGQLSMWAADQRDTLNSLQDAGLSITKEDVAAALGDVRDSTQVLIEDLKGLDPPETDEGQKARTELDNLGTELTQQVDTVQQALDANTSVVALASTATTALSTAVSDVSSTLDELQNLDSDELKDAFENSDDCTALRDEVESIGS